MDLLLLGGLKHVFDLLCHSVKSHCLVFYIHAVERFRGFFVRGLLALICLMLVLSGFLIVHVALFLYLPWEPDTKALVLLILGFVYLLIPLGLVAWLLSRPQWHKMSGVDEMLEQLSENKKVK